MRDYIDCAFRFAKAVIDGKLDAPQTVIQACRRFKRDLERSMGKRPRFVLDPERAHRACSFLERLPHVKGRWAAKGETFVLSDWQVFATVNMYGWVVKKTGHRRFRYSYIQVPRGNGKSFWFAGLGNYHLTADGDFGAEVYCGATSEKQAWEVFRPARDIWRRSEELRQEFGVEVNAKTLYVMSQGSRFEPVIGNPGDGSAPSCGIVDEYHEHKDSRQYDTFDTGLGKREAAILHVVTTAGASLEGPCHERYQECKKILDGAIRDDTVFVLIYEPDKGDRWDDQAVLKKVNPNYDVSVSGDYLLNQLQQARRSASKQNAFRTKHLNEWVGARTAWMNMVAWQRCKRPLQIEDFEGERCRLGLDLATKVDVAAVVATFKRGEIYHPFCFGFVPEGALERGDKRCPADVYRKFRHLDNFMLTEGDATDYREIEDKIFWCRDRFELVDLAYDGYQAEYLAQRLREPGERDGIEAIEFRHTVANMSEPMKEVEALVLAQRLQHNGDPLLTWFISNVRCRLDEKENVYPTKDTKDSPAKIDGAVALIMTIGLWLREREKSYLESGELVVL